MTLLPSRSQTVGKLKAEARKQNTGGGGEIFFFSFQVLHDNLKAPI